MSSVFGSHDEPPELDLSDQRIASVLNEIKRNSRNRRLALFAPAALIAAVLATLMAAPPRYGGLALVAEADEASTELPRVFGSNGVWRLAEPIAPNTEIDAVLPDPGPAAVIEAPADPSAPSFVLAPPDQEDLQSLPVSPSTPPMATPGQSVRDPEASIDHSSIEAGLAPAPEDTTDDIDWTSYPVIIRVAPEESVDVAPASDAAEPASDDAPPESSSPESSAPAEETTTPELSSPDEDVSGVPEANPSTPGDNPSDPEAQPSSMVASIVPASVLVYSAHVSVTVQVVDDDSSVIDWCNTRVDWGDGSVTGVADSDGVALCTASCEPEATPSAVGINESIEFTHEYTATIDAAPRIFVATGDGCSYDLAELQLGPFTVVPY